jgi:putative ABC transport system permease protein
MKRIYIVRRAARSLRHAKVRTLLTSLAIAVGAFTLTLSIAAGEGSRQYADKLIGSNINPRALFIMKDDSLVSGAAAQGQSGLTEYDPDTTTTRAGTVKQMTQADVDKLRTRGDLEDVQPMYQLQTKYVTFEGSDKKFTSEVAMYNSTIRNDTSAGTLPPLGTDLAGDDAVMPDSFADTLVKEGVVKDKSDLIGKKVTMTLTKPVAQPTEAELQQAIYTGGAAAVQNLTQQQTGTIVFTIRALTQQSSTALNAGSSIQVSSAAAKEIADFTTQGTSNYQKYTAVTALAKEGHTPESVKASLKQAGYSAQTAHDLQNLLFTIVAILQGIVAGFGVLALLASVFGIINTQYISVLERTSQIGLMKALGMRGRDVAKLFRYEAAWIGFLGGVIGAVFAWVIGSALNPFITKQLSLGDGNSLLIFQPVPIILLIVALMLIAVIAGWFPARKASKLDPIEALRTE